MIKNIIVLILASSAAFAQLALPVLSLAPSSEIELTPNNTIPLFGEINQFSGLRFLSIYHTIRKEYKGDLYLIIHSPGGETLVASDIINILKKDTKLHAVVLWAASAAAAISQNVGGKVYVIPKGSFLFHEVRVYVNRSVVTFEDAKKIYETLVKANIEFSKQCNSRMKLPNYSKLVKDTDWVLSSSQAEEVRAAVKQTFKCSDDLRAIEGTIPVYDYVSGVPSQSNFCDVLN